jgi:hypothetical protein
MSSSATQIFPSLHGDQVPAGSRPLLEKVQKGFLNAGYHNDQIGEVLIGVALKTLSNYTHHLSPVEIDSAFKAEA